MALCVSAKAQTGYSYKENYTPFAFADTSYKTEVLKHVKERYVFLIDSLSKKSRDKKKLYETIFSDRYDYIKSEFDDNEFTWDDSLSLYLRGILNKLIAANPEISGKKYLLTFRSSVPNAASTGDGIILFNLGLLNRLRNEGEVAFVLGHELAHDKYDHVLQSLVKYVQTVTDRDYKEKFEAAATSEYNAHHKLIQFMNGMLFSFNRHSRDHESEADSIGALWMIKAGYNPEYAISALQLLDSVDREKYADTINYNQIFSGNGYAFNNNWLQGTEFMQWYKSKEELTGENNDTVKTHPDCKKRIAGIRLLLLKQTATATGGNTSLENNINLRADFEIVQHFYDDGLYGASLYHSLQLIQVFPENAYLKAMIEKNLYFLYRSIKDHDFSAHTDAPSPYFSKNYNRFLFFINNIRSSELAALATNFCKKNGGQSNDPQLEYGNILCLSLSPDKTSVETLVSDYTHKHPGTKESKYLNEKLLTTKNKN
ncbi:MAG TPA: M48 family metallopeptidase [Chitinophagales bacterium]|nr:M48 family metallopeptidase [Chitinophagales bacterium]